MKPIDEALEAFESVSEGLLDELCEYAEPCAAALPAARFAARPRFLVAAMLVALSPQPAKAAAHALQADQSEKVLAKRFYWLLKTPRFRHRQWLKLLYADARQVVEGGVACADCSDAPRSRSYRLSTREEGGGTFSSLDPPLSSLGFEPSLATGKTGSWEDTLKR